MHVNNYALCLLRTGVSTAEGAVHLRKMFLRPVLTKCRFLQLYRRDFLGTVGTMTLGNDNRAPKDSIGLLLFPFLTG